MGTTPTGIDGVDLLELEIIHKERIPPVRDDLQNAASHLNQDEGLIFHRIGPIGNYPNGPSSAWTELARELQDIVSTSVTNLEDTRVAIKSFLDDILRADSGAKDRMDKARAEMEGI